MGISASLFYSDGDNCLDWRVRPSDEQYDAQKERWNDLADHLRADLKERAGCAIASWLQGSYKFGTQIRPAGKGQEFDIDLGIYFQWNGQATKGPHKPSELKTFVQDSLTNYVADDANDAEHVGEPRARCGRVHFKDDFHIDVPAYHLDASRDARALATDEGWEDSDPKAIYAWWKNNISEEERGQARRIARYLKMWAALQFSEKERPSSILLTVLAGKAYKTVDLGSLNGDDQVLEAIVENILEQLKRSRIVKNPTNDDENLNRLSDRDNDSLAFKLEELLTIADRALAAPTKLASAEIWSEAFYHFFPVPAATDDEMKTSKLTEDRSLVAAFDPIIAVRATGGGKSYEGTNRIGPIPRGCEIIFTLANAHMLPSGSTVHWMVRNAGREAETENDLGHRAGQGFNAKENSAYRGSHFMDVAVKRDGLLIGTRRVSVQITGLGIPLRNPPRPAWTKLRSRNR